ncbi:Uma2 family endonuclease [Algiphilus sp. W345]|uniref:Uma2 family endonuclease n=1 Tax=Banduia mediterranea TaxID=3075609 RepID=A0ABU2WMJ0_9GAMM|nr:Uma2 family endonuclease [Algiphilus sp. W345]MDT0499095.1 Uma2 family endonuclease [Algiphilus sp. W345]
MGLPRRDARYHTYADYLTWPEDLRYELIDGAAYLMAPAPAPDHQDVVGELFRQAANALEGKPCRPYLAPFDVRLPKGDEADERIDTVLQPDLLAICDRARIDRRGLARRAGLGRGSAVTVDGRARPDAQACRL